MAEILVAASTAPRVILERMLRNHSLSFAATMAEAEQLLRVQKFDLIVCTIVFDESRMFDLLRLAKSRAEWRSIPFVGARVRDYIFLSSPTLQAAALTCGELGAAAFLNITDYKVDPEGGMREAIEKFLPGTS